MSINSVGTYYNLRFFFYHRFLRRDDAGPLLTATISESSKMPRADWKQMKQYLVPLPLGAILRTFDRGIQYTIEQLKALTFSNWKSRAARDLLLPRLISGEISI